jgi:DMSO reductase anchor subunit
MHPAFSVIFFTVASGAGYGLLFVLALLVACGLVTPELWTGLIGFGVALALVTAGLLSSTFHLGRPERAWRAFSQWRSSWLSREGVFSVLTYGPAGLLALLFTFFAPAQLWLTVLGILTAVMCVLTVIATGMIYRSLKPIHAWCNRHVVPNYLILALATGAVLADAVLLATQSAARSAIVIVTVVAVLALLATLLAKRAYWHFIDTVPGSSTAESDTGLGHLGKVRLFEAPHTQENYLLKEMGYRVARKHAVKLRAIVQLGGLLVPAMLLLLGLLLPPLVALLLVVIAAIWSLAGALIERWLFFAEAKHSVMLYYGASTA